MRFITGVAVLLCVSVAFAGDNEAQKGGDVSGTITFDGKPLTSGTVTFVSKDGKQKVSTAIGEDGTYAAVLPKGEYSVGIGDPVAKKGDKEKPKELPIPAKYKSPDTSGLVISVTGKQTFDIVLQK